MKALILNSGCGTRMGDETKNHPKCMTELIGGQTILSRQLTQLVNAGITDIVVTTGLFEKKLQEHAKETCPNASIKFVLNPKYESTNYIYSIYLARHLLNSDLLLLHGDLVWQDEALKLLLQEEKSVMAVHKGLPLPEKDFKAVIENGRISHIGIDVFENAVEAQPLYKLQKADWNVWLKEIEHFIEKDECGVYAENAFNKISDKAAIYPLDLGQNLCAEIDTLEDLQKINKILKNMQDKLKGN